MSVWFEAEGEINRTLDDVKTAVGSLGALSRGYWLMPNITSVELVHQSPDSVTIQTNEGLIQRTNITRQVAADRLTVAFDEEHRAGSMVRSNAHFVDEFTPRRRRRSSPPHDQ